MSEQETFIRNLKQYRKKIAQVLDIKPSLLFDELSGGREILAVDTDSMIEKITNRLIQKMRPCVHDDIAEVLRELVD